MPRTGAYIMVRLAPRSRCNLTAVAAAAAGAARGGAAGADGVVAAAAVAAQDSSYVCVASMMAQEGEHTGAAGSSRVQQALALSPGCCIFTHMLSRHARNNLGDHTV